MKEADIVPGSAERFREAVSGAEVLPPVAGLSFVAFEALQSSIARTKGPAEALAEACDELDLDFAFVPAGVPWAPRAVALLTDAGKAPVWAVDGPLWPVLRARGIHDGLRLTAADPEALEVDLDAETDRAVAQAAFGIRIGAVAVAICDDLATSAGPLVAPDFALAEVLPRMSQAVFAASEGEVPAIWHSDGDIRTLVGGAARAGFSAVHVGGGLSPDRFEDVFWSARKEGLSVIGGLLTSALSGGPMKAVAMGVKAALLADAGGLLLADDGGIVSGAEFDAFTTAMEAARVRGADGL